MDRGLVVAFAAVAVVGLFRVLRGDWDARAEDGDGSGDDEDGSVGDEADNGVTATVPGLENRVGMNKCFINSVLQVRERARRGRAVDAATLGPRGCAPCAPVLRGDEGPACETGQV